MPVPVRLPPLGKKRRRAGALQDASRGQGGAVRFPPWRDFAGPGLLAGPDAVTRRILPRGWRAQMGLTRLTHRATF